MDMLVTDEARQWWSSHIDQLFNGEMKWDDFNNLVADELGFKLDQWVNSMGPDGMEPDLLFLKLDAKIAVNPNTAAAMFRQSIDRFADPDANDHRVWDWVMRKVKPDMVTAMLQKAHVHHSISPKGHQDAASRGSSPDTGNNILLDGKQHSAVQTSRVPMSNTMLPGSYGHVDLNAGMNQGDRLTTPMNTPSDHTPDVISEYQDDSQFTATHEEGDQSTGNKNFVPESLFSLVDVQQSINAFIYDGISFNEFHNILLTDTPPPIHEKTVHEVLQTLDPGHADRKMLNALLEKLQVEEALAIGAADVASMN
ncbi:hypothetical protein BDR05DRAFT_952078 [Suillus weaverae]|nr:hypothetical protein BDR05DRAFT_952078 [Suillus weaverae]